MSTPRDLAIFCLIFLLALHPDSILAKKHKKRQNEHKKVVHKKVDVGNLTMPELCSNRPNSVLRHCAAGYNECLPSCSIPHPDPDRCFKTNDCVPRCICHKGFVSELSNGEGQCLRLEECDKKNCDDPNAELNRCIASIRCIPTCEHPKPREHGCWTVGECSLNPRPRCICKEGFVSLEEEGEGPCVPLAQCPKKLEEGGMEEGENIHEPAPPLGEEEGHVRMEGRGEEGEGGGLNRICGDPNASPQKCRIQEECIPSCQNPPDSMPLYCVQNEEAECEKAERPFCICNGGFVNKRMDGKGNCVKLEECVKKRKRTGKGGQMPMGPPRGEGGEEEEGEEEGE